MAKFPAWLRLSEIQRNSVSVELRTWHPSFWRYMARELKRTGSIDLAVSIGRRRFAAPAWLTAELAAAWAYVSIAFGKGRG